MDRPTWGDFKRNERKTFSGVPGDSRCECSDPACPVQHPDSNCRQVATTILYRVDMEDVTGTAMCDACASDAMESGLFTDKTEEMEADNG